jgi:CheY-like chemotaxis protein
MPLHTHNQVLQLTPHFSYNFAVVRPARLSQLILKQLKDLINFSDQSNPIQPPSQPSGSTAAPATAQSEAEPVSRNILLVDDAEDNRLLIQVYLRKTQFQLKIAENGQVAVEMFKSDHFDLVLMDMQMPVMDGYTATSIIREWEVAQGRPPTPILALTAYALKEDIQKALDAGCTAYLTKPVKKATLLETLSKYTNGEA